MIRKNNGDKIVDRDHGRLWRLSWKRQKKRVEKGVVYNVCPVIYFGLRGKEAVRVRRFKPGEGVYQFFCVDAYAPPAVPS